MAMPLDLNSRQYDSYVENGTGTTCVRVYNTNEGTVSVGTIASVGYVGTLNLGTITRLEGGSVAVTAGTVGTVGTVAGVAVVSSLTNGSIVVTNATIGAGTLAVSAGTVGTVGTVAGVAVVSEVTNGSMVVTNATIGAGTLAVSAGTVGTVGTVAGVAVVSELTNGSIVVTNATVGAGTVVVSNGTIGAGTLAVSAGTVGTVGTVAGMAVLSSLTNGSINVTAGTFREDPRPNVNILSYGTLFGGTAAVYGTLVGSAGVGTSIWVNDITIVNQSGTVVECSVGFGTALAGSSVLVIGSFADQGGVQKSFPKAVNAGMTNSDLVCHVGAAGTAAFNVSYFVSA